MPPAAGDGASDPVSDAAYAVEKQAVRPCKTEEQQELLSFAVMGLGTASQ